MSDNIEVGRWENKLLEIDLWTLRIGKEFYFFGKEVALALGYTNTKDAIHEHIDHEDKIGVEKLLAENYKTILIENFSGGRKNRPLTVFLKLQKNYLVIKEVGLYSLCVKSRKEKAKPFQKWIFNTAQTIRETGFYALPGGPVDNPLDLIAEISKVKVVEKETHTQQSKEKITITRERGTQTQDIESVKDSFRRLRGKLEKSIKEVESELKKSLGETISSRSSSSYSSSSRRSNTSDN